MTNFPADLVSFTAKLNSSSKKEAICFFDTGLSLVLTFSVMTAIILDLLSGFAIEFLFLLRSSCLWAPASRMPRATIAALGNERKEKCSKNPGKTHVSCCREKTVAITTWQVVRKRERRT